MGFRLRKTIKVFPGLSINLSKSGVSVSAGVKGAKVTVGKNGVRKTVGVPGTGISYTDYTRHGGSVGQPPAGQPAEPAKASPIAIILGFIFILFIGYCLAAPK